MFKRTFNNSRPDDALYDFRLSNLQIVSGSDWRKIIRDEAQAAPEQEIPRKEPRSLMLSLCAFVVFLTLYMGALIHLGQSIQAVIFPKLTGFSKGANKHILLAVDGAGWHISKDLKLPPGLHLTFLSSYSPELQLAEKLWSLVSEPMANQYFETLDDLKEVLFHKCQSLLQQQNLIQELTDFHWWVRIGA